MLPVQSVLEDLVVGVKLIQDRISVLLLACRKHNYLEFLSHLLQETQSIWPNVHPEMVHLRVILQPNAQPQVSLRLVVIHTMDQSLIQIQHQGFLLAVILPTL